MGSSLNVDFGLGFRQRMPGCQTLAMQFVHPANQRQLGLQVSALGFPARLNFGLNQPSPRPGSKSLTVKAWNLFEDFGRRQFSHHSSDGEKVDIWTFIRINFQLLSCRSP